LEAPEDMDAAMAWLEELAAQQGAALEELPTLSGSPEAAPESPEQGEEEAASAAEASVETPPETAEFDEYQADETDASEESLPDDEADLLEGDTDTFPDWFDADTGPLDQALGQTQWLSSLETPDVAGWLEEEEGTLSSIHDRVARSRYPSSFDTGPLPETGSLELPEEENITSVFALDDEQLASARQAVKAGAFDDAVETYQSLITAGGGMMTLIADLESVADEHQDQPLFRHLLGDAYMQNGQLQKALDTYRVALDQI
jgi:tetratricopeptide (TPR) repeat protein